MQISGRLVQTRLASAATDHEKEDAHQQLQVHMKVTNRGANEVKISAVTDPGFPRGGVNPKGNANLLFGKTIAENCPALDPPLLRMSIDNFIIFQNFHGSPKEKRSL